MLDPGTILLKFQAGHFVGFRRFFPHRQYGGGARRGPCGGTWAFAKQGFQAATVWQFGLWDIKIAFWRDELPPDWEAPPLDQADGIYLLYSRLVACPKSKAMARWL